MTFRKTSIELDEALLNRARQALGTETIKDTVEQALLEVLRERARRDEVRALSTMRGMDLDIDKVMSKAWRA